MRLMAVPGRTFHLRGDPQLNSTWIIDIFLAEGFRIAGEGEGFPIRLRHGSRVVDLLTTTNELGALFLALPGARKKIFPQEVTIHSRGPQGQGNVLRIETRPRAGVSTLLVQSKFDRVLQQVIEDAQRREVLIEVSDLTDSVRG